MRGNHNYRKKIICYDRILSATLLIILFFNFNNCKAQHYEKQSREFLAYNILLNGCIGGVGGAINKSKNEKVVNAFTKNFLKGALGGVITYEAKYMVYPLRKSENFWMAPLIRAGYYAGYSMTYNASLNRSLFDSYHCQFYVFNFDVPIKQKAPVLTRISFSSTLSAATMFAIGNKLDVKNSLKYGVLYFDQNMKFTNDREGFALSNAIEVISKKDHKFTELRRNTTIAHEMVHTFQFADYFSITNIYFPSIMDKSNIGGKKIYNLKNYIFFDVPYFPVLYASQPDVRNTPFFELEAYHFETRKYVRQ